jgi:pimeloyl-ACP methyl ester carboxylesterase
MRLRPRVVVPVAVVAILGVGLVSQLRSDIPLEELKARWAPPPSKFVDVDGMSIHYRDEGSGPALVLVHGTGSHLFTWDGWVKALSNRFRVIRLDTPGFGLTGPHPREDYRISEYVNVLDHFLAKVGVDRFALAGNSLGGDIAWNYAVAHPQKVSALVLVDSAGYPHEGPKPIVFTIARWPVLPALMAKMDPSMLVKRTLQDCYGDPSKVRPDDLERYIEMTLRAGNRAAFSARVSTPYEDHTAALAGIQAPTLILWGAKDGLIDVKTSARFASAIHGSQVKIYDALGHVPMEEDPERTAADVATFLTRANPI